MPSFAQLLSSTSLASSLSAGIPQALSDYSAVLTNAGIIPDAIPRFNGQPLGLSLANTPYPFDIGQGYTVAQTQVIPQYSLDPVFASSYAAANQTFVIIYADPDALSPQDRTEAAARHYIGPNYVVDATGALTNTTPALSDFFGPAPPAGTFNHRYTHLLYLQPPNFVQSALQFLNGSALVLDPTIPNPFGPFLQLNITTFATATGLADPVAATFFMTAPDGVPVHTTSGQAGALAAAGVAPGVAPVFNPLAILDLSYSNVSGRNFLVRTGENFTDTNAATAPQLLLSFNSTVAAQLASQTFTAIAIDLDAQTPQNLHLIAQDLTIGSTINSFAPLTSTSTPLVSYTGPITGATTAHRYAFLVFIQPPNFTQLATPLVPAAPFNLASFRAATGLGKPIAGTYFLGGQNLLLQ